MDKIAPSVGGYLIGFIVSTLIWGETEGSVGLLPNLRIALGGKEVLLHHWMLFLILLALVLIFRSQFSTKLFYFLLGAIIGGLHQGLTYKDWLTILK